MAARGAFWSAGVLGHARALGSRLSHAAGGGRVPALRSAKGQDFLGAGRGLCAQAGGQEGGKAPYDVVVFGGNGFVGSNVCQALVTMGKRVAAVNRSGAPSRQEPWMDKVDFIKGDVFEPESWRDVLKGGVGGVVASIGAFGSYEQMKKINGDANIIVTEEAAGAGVQRMVFVSASFPPFPASIPLRGYIEGKQAVEAIVRERFPDTHTILKPSVIFGPQDGAHPLIQGIRALGPLQEPVMTHTPLSKLSGLPGIGGVFLPWSPVHAVGKAAATAATQTLSKRMLMPCDIAEYK